MPANGHTSYLGHANLTQNVNKKPNAKNSISVQCEYFLEFKKDHPGEAALFREYGTHEEVVPTTENMNVRIQKADKPMVYPSPDDPTHASAVEFTTRHLHYMHSSVLGPGDEMNFKSNSAAGILGKAAGITKTAEYIGSKIFEKYKWNTDHVPIQIVNFKDEFLSQEDLNRKKIRFVDSVDKTFLFKQKYFFDNQNHKLVEHCETGWIKYGYSKQFGGFNRLITKFEKCNLISLSDISGYDISALLKKVYEIRLRLLTIRGSEETLKKVNKVLEYVLFFTQNPVRLHPDGQILLFDGSNSSGQNNTAPDNCILHEIIIFDLLSTLFMKLHNRYPLYEEIIKNVECALYSDDKMLGLHGLFSSCSPELFQATETEVYAKYGMTIKASASKVITHTPFTKFEDGELEFLGSTNYFSESHDSYFGTPRVDKLCTSLTKQLVCTRDKLSPRDQYLKLIQLKILLVHTMFHDAVCVYVNWFQKKYSDLNYLEIISELEYMDDLKGTDDRSLDLFLTGNESAYNMFGFQSLSKQKPLDFNFFFDEARRLGGLKEILAMDTSIAKAEQKIEVLSEKVGASDDGVLWIKEALDPFSDMPRRPVGFPDLITGNSIIQVIKSSFTVDCTEASDVHLFLDTMDTGCVLQEQSFVSPSNPSNHGGAVVADTTPGTTHVRGGLVIRRAATGTPLTANTTVGHIALPDSYTTGGSVRVLSKAFEVHNTTNKLQVGGSVAVYRDTASIPYDDKTTTQVYSGLVTGPGCSFSSAALSEVPQTLADVIRIPGSQQWEAQHGCYNVAIMGNQTNNPQDVFDEVVTSRSDGEGIGKLYANVYSGLPSIPILFPGRQLFSPFFLSGAYFTGLPTGSKLTINTIYIIERFVKSTNLDLIVLATPSPYYDPIAQEIYAKSACRLPHGVKVRDNADGDWIKNIADVLSNFGVPGMALVKGGVDLYNTYQRGQLKPNKSHGENLRIAQMEKKLAAMGPTYVGSPGRSANGNIANRNKAKQKKKKKNPQIPKGGMPKLPSAPRK